MPFLRIVSFCVFVECYSGHTYAQEPRAVEWNEQRFEVETVVKRWRTPAGPVFRVDLAMPNSQTLNAVELQYLELEDRWTMRVQT